MINKINTQELNIYGIGFNEQIACCFKKELLNGIRPFISKMEITNDIPTDADVIILNLDVANSIPLLQKSLPADDCFVIVIAHEITRKTLPYIKLADHVVFINQIQHYLCDEFLNLNIESHTIFPYPFGSEVDTAHDLKNAFVYFEGDQFSFEENDFLIRAELILQYLPIPEITQFHFVIEHWDENENFETLQKQLNKLDKRITAINANELAYDELIELISTCPYGHVFKKEITIEMYVEAMENQQAFILFDALEESPVLAAMMNLSVAMNPSYEKSFYNYTNSQHNNWQNWGNEINDIISTKYTDSKKQKEKARTQITKDQLTDLNIIAGQPLVNNYVFSICFRNQEDKIERCIESIINQTGNHDIGLAIVSDQSTDDSCIRITQLLKDKNIDFVLVDNKDRKYASRNYYNVAHLLTQNDEAVISEVDGDDFLASNEVVSILDGYYKKGALKTNGSYQMYPKEQTFTSQEELQLNHDHFDPAKPWYLDQCTAWLHLRTAKRHLICKVEIDHFLERKSKKWLTDRHDTAVQPRIIELAGEHAVFVKEVLYNYDVSGENHDHSGDDAEQNLIVSYQKYDTIYYPIAYA